jgi:hypothetical protein
LQKFKPEKHIRHEGAAFQSVLVDVIGDAGKDIEE